MSCTYNKPLTWSQEVIIEDLEHKIECYKKENKQLKVKVKSLQYELEAIQDARTVNP